MSIRIQPLCCLYFISMAVLTSWTTTIGAILALTIHELGHLAACRLLCESIATLELTPLGGVLTYAQDKTPSKGIKGICIAAAGPAANYLFLALSAFFPDWLDYNVRKAIVSSNAVMLCINLFPVLPLDGGRILFCLGYYVFPVARLITVLSNMGIAAGVGFLLLAIYSAAKLGYLNCSVLIVGIYLAYCARKCRAQMMTENLYAILQESEDNRRLLQRIRLYQVSEDTQLIRLLPLLGGAFSCEFVFHDGKTEYRISEKTLCIKLLEQPLISIKKAFSQ